ncbi:hypothetical protein BDN72DRAFT_265942 [Pluteus cervinus]|uniref:Uncharacterized protein n=1 Tax=Pluteus cervinus TaxID=181527 RepID=A0ACD3AG22_9AGAR|nr:hypothetical protein BDN72DRAFT_265942 [Pluteus cervinus]
MRMRERAEGKRWSTNQSPNKRTPLSFIYLFYLFIISHRHSPARCSEICPLLLPSVFVCFSIPISSFPTATPFPRLFTHPHPSSPVS